jgi:hypothetical protein
MMWTALDDVPLSFQPALISFPSTMAGEDNEVFSDHLRQALPAEPPHERFVMPPSLVLLPEEEEEEEEEEEADAPLTWAETCRMRSRPLAIMDDAETLFPTPLLLK